MPTHHKTLSTFVALFLCASTFAAAQQAAPEPALGTGKVIDLPQMGEPADLAMSPAQEQMLGKQVVGELFANNYVLEDAELTEYISSIGWKLAAASQTKPPQLSFMVIADDRINAFALPGGYIGVNAGLLLAATNESEVAGVLGHELAHVTQRHIARAQEGEQAATIATWAAVLAAIIAGSANPDIVIGALSLGQAVTYQRQVSYTRSNEQEADRFGIQTMAAAGFDAEGMASFFTRLQQQARLYGSGMPEILRTHPLNTSRIAEARARIAAIPRITRKDPVDFSLMQARARAMAADSLSEAVEYFSGQVSSGRDAAANRYGLAYALSERGEYDNAISALKPALTQFPRQVNLNLLLGHLQLSLNRHEEGLATLQRTLALYPRYAPAIFTYADALMTAGKPDEARQVLISHEQALGMRLQTYNLLALAARDMNNSGEAAFQMANYLFLRGDAGGALAQLDAGLRTASLSKQDRARLMAKRQEIRDSMPRDWRPPRDDGQRMAFH